MLERKAVHHLYSLLTKRATAAAAAVVARIINNVDSVNMYTCYIHTSIFHTYVCICTYCSRYHITQNIYTLH